MTVYGKEPTEANKTGVGAIGQLRSTFGWTEKDGVVEKVFYGDSVLIHDEVHINPCHTWYVHTTHSLESECESEKSHAENTKMSHSLCPLFSEIHAFTKVVVLVKKLRQTMLTNTSLPTTE